jgi:hypothetical protein
MLENKIEELKINKNNELNIKSDSIIKINRITTTIDLNISAYIDE